jgi:hypothetical protein
MKVFTVSSRSFSNSYFYSNYLKLWRGLFERRRYEKFGIFPLTLPSPARGEGKQFEI